MHHRLAGRKNALALGVPGRIGKVADHVLLDLFRRIEAEHRQVADVELDDLVAFVLHALRALEDRTPDVVTDVVEFGRFADHLHEGPQP